MLYEVITHDEVVDALLLTKTHFVLGRMNIDIDHLRWKVEEQHRHRITTLFA